MPAQLGEYLMRDLSKCILRTEDFAIRQSEGRTNLRFGDYTSMSAGWKRSRKPTRWPKVIMVHLGSTALTFNVIEESGVESFLNLIQDELVHNTYQPMPMRKKEILKDCGQRGRKADPSRAKDPLVMTRRPPLKVYFKTQETPGKKHRRTAQPNALK